MRSAIAIPTQCKRDLNGLLSDISRQVQGVDVVLVVHSGCNSHIIYELDTPSLVESFLPGLGYSRARNEILRLAKDYELDVLGLLDDDMRIREEWFKSHMNALEWFAADVSFGPIHRKWDVQEDPTIVKANLPRRHSQKTGVFTGTGVSGNVVLKMQSVISTGVIFDLKFDFIGGEDSAYFQDLKKAGMKMCWNVDASAFEVVPLGFFDEKSILERAKRNAATSNLSFLQVVKRGIKGALLELLSKVLKKKHFSLIAKWNFIFVRSYVMKKRGD